MKKLILNPLQAKAFQDGASKIMMPINLPFGDKDIAFTVKDENSNLWFAINKDESIETSFIIHQGY